MRKINVKNERWIMPPSKHTKKIGRQPLVVAEKTKLDIIQSAAKIFADKGYDGASIRIITKNLGISHGMIRHHFGTKEDLWIAVIDYLINQFAIDRIPPREQMEDIDPAQLLKSYIRNFINMSARYPELGQIILKEGGKKGKRLHYILAYVMPLHRLIDPVFYAVQKKGLLHRYNPESFFLFIVAAGAAPMALAPLTDAFCGGKILSPGGIQKHADLVIATLFDD